MLGHIISSKIACCPRSLDIDYRNWTEMRPKVSSKIRPFGQFKISQGPTDHVRGSRHISHRAPGRRHWAIARRPERPVPARLVPGREAAQRSFRKRKAAVKLHTLLDLGASIPTTVIVTTGTVHDVNIMNELFWEAGSIYVMDRGYVDFARLYRIQQDRAFFVTRAKKNFRYQRLYSHKATKPPAFAAIKPWCFAASTFKRIILTN
jgi:hypothetical protein